MFLMEWISITKDNRVKGCLVVICMTTLWLAIMYLFLSMAGALLGAIGYPIVLLGGLGYTFWHLQHLKRRLAKTEIELSNLKRRFVSIQGEEHELEASEWAYKDPDEPSK